jgi:hypothetical protein
MIEIRVGMNYVLFVWCFSFLGLQVTYLLPTGNMKEDKMKVAVPNLIVSLVSIRNGCKITYKNSL